MPCQPAGACGAGLHPRAGMRVLDNEYKLRQNIKIAMLYLEDDDAINAEAFIKKAASLITSSKARARAPLPFLQPLVTSLNSLQVPVNSPIVGIVAKDSEVVHAGHCWADILCMPAVLGVCGKVWDLLPD